MEQLSGNSNAGRGVAEGHSPAALWPHPTVNIYISTIHIYDIYILNTASASQLSRDAMFPAWRAWQTWQRWYTQRLHAISAFDVVIDVMRAVAGVILKMLFTVFMPI